MKRLAWVSAMALGASLCAGATNTIKEPETGKVFDAQVAGATPGVTLSCTGVACREKTALGVDVYAIAHWVDAKGAQGALAKWKGKKGKDIAADQAFYDALCAADVEKRLSLVFVRDVDAGAIRDAFQESLTIAYGGALTPEAQQFLALFKADVKNGQIIEIHSLPGGVVEVMQNGSSLGALPANPQLAMAVWAIYFHEKLADSHLKSAKPRLVANVETIW